MTTGTYLKLAKDQGEIMDNKQARDWHRMLDRLAEGNTLSPQNIESLRKALPELPKQMTLEEIHKYVDDAWLKADDPESKEWLHELHAQLKGLEVAATISPALPAGMRIAEHENFGRVVVSPEVGVAMCYEIFHLDPGFSSGTDISGVEPESLTFIDSEPAHPAFLETEEDYANAPEGTIVAGSGQISWAKEGAGYWACSVGAVGDCSMTQSKPRRVLRWGWGHE